MPILMKILFLLIYYMPPQNTSIIYRSIIGILGQGKTICNLGQGDFQ
jgi:hypothetical protein